MKKKASIKEEFFLKLSTRAQAILELICAGTLWGFGFVATVWALKGLSPSALIFYRFFIAFAVGIFFLLLTKTSKQVLKKEALLSLVPGFFLWLLLIFQTWGLQTTTATNSGFITTLYVIWVPLFRFIYTREKMGWVYWISVAMAMVGTLFILNWQKFDIEHLNTGDMLTLICSFFAAAHILIVGQRAPRSENDFAFNIFQSFWVCIPCAFILPFSTEGWNLLQLDRLGWMGLISLALGSSLIAFFLQVRAQKNISPSTASLLFLLESPVSCLFAFWLLSERLGLLQIFGAVLIITSCVLISLPRRGTAPKTV